MVDLIQNVVYRADVSGLKQAASAADQLAGAEKRVAEAGKSAAASTESQSKSAISAASRLNALTLRNNELAKAMANAMQVEGAVNRARAQGVTITSAHEYALANARRRVDELSKATHGHTAALGLNRMQAFESMHIVKSLTDSMIAGTGVFRAFSLEAGRIGEVLASGEGGVGGTLKAMGGLVGRLATGWAGLGVGVAGGLALAGAAVIRFEAQQDKLAQSLNGVGRAAGLSLGGITGLANAAAARNPALGQGGATNLAAQLAGTGRISGAIMPGLLDVAQPFSRATGQDLSKGGEELAKAFSNPAKGAEMLDEKLSFLDDKTRVLISSMSASGDVLGAQKLLLDKVAQSAAGAADRTWTLQKRWEDLKGKVGGAMDIVGSTFDHALSPQRADIASRLDSAKNTWAPFRNNDEVAELTKMLAKLDADLAKDDARAKLAQRDIEANRASTRAGEIVNGALPDIAHQRDLQNKIDDLSKAIADPDVMSRTAGGSAAALRARDALQNGAANSDPLQRVRQDSALTVQSIQAHTLAERLNVDARRAELEAMRGSKETILALAEAEGKRNEALAQGRRELEDFTKNAQRDFNYAGMSPYDAARARARDQLQDLQDKTGGGFAPSARSSTVYGDLRGGTPSWGSGVNPELVSRTERLLAAIPGLTVISGRRTEEQQAALYAQLAGTGHPVAPPGTSLHERGLAVDLGGGSGAVSRARALAGQYGLSFPVRGDFNHMQLAGGGAPANSNVASGGMSAAASAVYGRIDRDMLEKPLKDANLALDGQIALFRIQADAVDHSKSSLAAMAEKQKLVNDYARQGIDIMSRDPAGLNAFQSKAYAFAKEEEAFQKKIQGLDSIRSDSNSFLHSFVEDLVKGESAAKAMRAAMEQLGQKLLSSGLDRVTDVLLGQKGSPGGGLLGGLLGSASGGLGSLFSGFHFADGGVMTSGGPVPLRRYADGGVANSPQAAIFGEGSGPEAFIPLKGGAVPVRMQGGAPSHITVQGHTIVVQGAADDKAINQLRAELFQAQASQTRDLQRNFQTMQSRANGRYGSAA